MRVLVVAGARPNFMKVAPVLAALAEQGHEHVLVHTGQHYDYRMSETFFEDLSIPAPDHYLNVGSGSHAVQTAKVMEAFEPVLLDEKADWVLVPGDVNSTLAAALVTVKLKAQTGTRLAHLEAGLRSHDWRMPEEVNRVLTDRCSDLLLTPSHDARPNLIGEGVAAERIAFVGNVMIDTLHARLPTARSSRFLEQHNLTRGAYIAATLHRPSNVDEPEALRICIEALAELAERMPVVIPVHPRTRKMAQEFGLDSALEKLTVLEPLGYTQMLAITDGAAAMLTDSGGLQEETTALGVPCVTLREQTERPITITEGTNRLAPWPLTRDGILTAADEALSEGRVEGSRRPDGWDGRAAFRVVEALVSA